MNSAGAPDPWLRTPLARACIVALILAASSILGAPARAAGRAECSTVPSKILHRAVPFCILLPPSYDADKTRRYPILYFLHGLNENAQILLNSGGWDLIQDLWSDHRIGEFLIVTPSADDSFYINSLNGRDDYQSFFIREFLPYIEHHYRTRDERRERGVGGVSMGGYGALRFAFLYSQLFGSVSAHSAALIEQPDARIAPSVADTITQFMGTAFGSPFNRAYWIRESPFTIVKTHPRPAGLKIYFDCGTEDSFGFNRGAAKFHELLDSRNIPNEFHLYPGSHNWQYFAQHLPASLEFQSRSFGLTPTGGTPTNPRDLSRDR
ncbi:MAG: alpha/beta hydrolase family protein [Candidatus Acidiferrales bacterium]